MRSVILALLAVNCASLHADADVIQLKEYRLKRGCTSYLTRGNLPATAEIYPFPPLTPPFVDSKEFLEEYYQNDDESVMYFYFHGPRPAPFSKYNAGSWSTKPHLPPPREELFVLKTRLKKGVKLPTAERWQVETLRRLVQFDSYTRLRVPQLLHVVHQTILYVRTREMLLSQQPYQAPELSFKNLVSFVRPKYKALDLINSWLTVSDHEREFQMVLKELIHKHILHDTHVPDVEPLIADLRSKLLEIYQDSPF